VQRRWLTSALDDSELNTGAPPLCGSEVASAILLLTAQVIEAEALARAQVPILGIVWAAELTARGNEFREAATKGATTGQAMAMVLRAAWDSDLGWVVPLLNTVLMEEPLGTPPPGRAASLATLCREGFNS
jgi:hypothetical protein